MKKNAKSFGFYAVILLVLALVLGYLYKSPQVKERSYAEVLSLIEAQQVDTLTVSGTDLSMTLKDGTTVEKTLPSFELFIQDAGDEIKSQKEAGIITDYDYPAPATLPWWVSLLPYVLLIGVFIFLWMYMIGNAGGGGGKMMSFGKAKPRMLNENQKKVTFLDVAGADEEKEELWEVVDFLKAPKRFTQLGARIPKGILMVGPPGTGKTLLAKAVAGEAGVPFFSISGSDFVEMFVGVGASRVRDLFEQAKKNAPCIVFIDEIDAVGRQRGAGLGGGHDEREQTLNQLLVEMDGFGVNEGVIVMAATNRADILDPALMRPGRFDRQVYVYPPDMRGRIDILKVHSRGKPLADDVDFTAIAGGTIGFTGADLENLMNEAALLAARRCKKQITMSEVSEATMKVMMGPEKKSKIKTEKALKLTAYHEAGHALIFYLLDTLDDVHEITTISRGPAGGYTLALPKEEKSYNSRQEMLDDLVASLGGRVAEKLVLNDISTGASSDIQHVSKLARDMVTKYGMSDSLGPIAYGLDHTDPFLGRDLGMGRNYSEATAAEIDDEVKRIVDNAYERCTQLLSEHREQLERVAQSLIKREKLNAEEFRMVMEGKELPPIVITEEKKAPHEPSFYSVQQPSQPAAPTLPDEGHGTEEPVTKQETPPQTEQSEEPEPELKKPEEEADQNEKSE